MFSRSIALVALFSLVFFTVPHASAFIDAKGMTQNLEEIERQFSGDSTGLGGLMKKLEEAAEGSADAYLQQTIDGKIVTFWDVGKEAWFYGHVLALMELGIVSGYKDASGKLTGSYGPGDNVTREQALKIALGSAGVNPAGCQGAASSKVSDWAKQYSVCANQMDFGIGGADLRGNATRAELLHYTLKAFGASVPEGTPPFADSKGHKYKNDIAYAYALDIVSGDKNPDGSLKGTFRPDAAVNRAETSKIAKLAIGNL